MPKKRTAPILEDDLFINGTNDISTGFIDERYWPTISESNVNPHSNEFNKGRILALPGLS
jgi:hypothetical protein